MVVTGCAGSGKTMLAVEHAKRLAADGQARAVRLLQPARCATTCGRPRRTRGVEFNTFHALCIQLAKQGRRCKLPQYDAGEPPTEYFDEELPTRSSSAIEKLGPQYDALFVDEAQDLQRRLARRADCTLRDADERARSGCSWTTTSASTRTGSSVPDGVPAVRPDRQLPQHAGDPPRGDEEVRGRDRARGVGPAGRDVELIHTDDQPARRRRRSSASAAGGGPAAGRRRPLSSHGIENSAVARPLPGSYAFVDEPAAARRLRPLLLDPRLQGPRVTGRDPLRARGPRRRDARPAALRRASRGPATTA